LKKRFHARKKYAKLSEFKFSRDKEFIRRKLLEIVAEEDLEVGYVAIDKGSVKRKLRDDPRILYNYLVAHFAITNVLAKHDVGEIKFIIDKSLPKETRHMFDDYLKDKLHWKQVVEKDRKPVRHSITHQNSQGDPCLQAVDYLAGAAFSKFERNDSRYYGMIKHKIQFRNSWGKISW
jgi:hypothetical protein